MKPAGKKKPANNHIVVETVNNDVTELEAIDGARPKKPLSAMFYYQQEKFAVAQQKHPEMSKQNVMKLLAKDYNDLPEKKKVGLHFLILCLVFFRGMIVMLGEEFHAIYYLLLFFCSVRLNRSIVSLNKRLI